MKLDSSVGIPDFILPCGMPVAGTSTQAPLPPPPFGAPVEGGTPVNNVLILPARDVGDKCDFIFMGDSRLLADSARVVTRGKVPRSDSPERTSPSFRRRDEQYDNKANNKFGT